MLGDGFPEKLQCCQGIFEVTRDGRERWRTRKRRKDDPREAGGQPATIGLAAAIAAALLANR